MLRLKNLIGRLLLRLPNKPYVYLFYYRHTGKWLNLKNPRRFGQKLQWLKLYGRLENFTEYADKYTVRDYVARKVGEQYLVPLLGVWDSVDDIPFDDLPQQFVLKVSRGCGYNIICKNKSQLDIPRTKRQLKEWMETDFWRLEREPQYKNAVPRIMCEQYIEAENGDLPDYKIMCSRGEPIIIKVDTDRATNHKTDLLDVNWERLTYVFDGTFLPQDHLPVRPDTVDEMLDVARKLSADFPFVRVDLYSVRGKVYFGELTFTPGSGIIELNPESGEIQMGDMIDLEAFRNWKPAEA